MNDPVINYNLYKNIQQRCFVNLFCFLLVYLGDLFKRETGDTTATLFKKVIYYRNKNLKKLLTHIIK